MLVHWQWSSGRSFVINSKSPYHHSAARTHCCLEYKSGSCLEPETCLHFATVSLHHTFQTLNCWVLQLGMIGFAYSLSPRRSISAAATMLSHLQEIGSIDSHVAFVLLRFYGGFSNLSYTAPTMASAALKAVWSSCSPLFPCFGINTTTESWLQAQLSLNGGGRVWDFILDLFHHYSAAYIASFCKSDCASPGDVQIKAAIDLYNHHVMPFDLRPVYLIISV